MTDVMALGVSFQADSGPAIAAFKEVESAGKRAAGVLTTTTQQASSALKTLGFSAKIASVDGIERIVVEGRQLEVVNRILGRMAPGMTAVAVEATKAAAATEKAAAATGRAASAARSGGVSYQRWGNAALRGAGALMIMGDALDGNDKSMQQLLRTGSSIAFMFGPTGAIIGSLGILASFFVKAFDKAQEAIKKTKDETQKLIDKGKELTDSPGFASLGSARETGFQQMKQLATLRKQVADAEAQNLLAQKQWATASLAGAATFAKPVSKEDIKGWKEQIANLEKATTATVKLTGVLTTHEQAEQDAADAVKAANEAEKERIRIIEGEVGWLKQLREFGVVRVELTNRARDLEVQYATALGAENLSIEQQIILLKKLADARAASGGLGGMMERGKQPGLDIPGQNPILSPFAMGAQRAVDRNIAGMMRSLQDPEKVQAAMEELGGVGASAFGDGLARGLSGLFEGLFSGDVGKGIEDLGKGVLASFGRMLQQFGAAALAANKWIMGIFAGLGTPTGIIASLGLIALGSLLVGLAGGGGGRGRGGGSGAGRSFGGGGGSGQSPTERLTNYTYNARTGMTSEIKARESNTYLIMGSNPQLERFFSKIATKADRRQLNGFARRNRMGVRINGA